MCLKNQNDLDHPYLESAIALSDRLYTKVEVSINAIATETAVYNALLPWHAFQKKFRLEIARLTIFKGNEGQFTTAMGPEANLRWRFHSLSGPRLFRLTNEAPPSQPRLRLMFCCSHLFFASVGTTRKKCTKKPKSRSFTCIVGL